MNLGESWEMGHQLAYLAGSDIGGQIGGDGADSSNATGKTFDIDQYSAVVRPMGQVEWHDAYTLRSWLQCWWEDFWRWSS